MQENLTIAIDSQERVFYGGVQVGEGDEAFQAALTRVPLAEINTIRVRDERVKEENRVEGEYPKAQEWEFPGDVYASAQEGMESTSSTLYALTPTKARELRDMERVYLEPAVQATVYPETKIDWSALREDIRRERAEKAGIVTNKLFEGKPATPVSDEPFRIRSLKEREEERRAAEEAKRLEEEEAQIKESEQEVQLLAHHEQGEDIEWSSSSESVRDDPKNYLDEKVQFLTKTEQEEELEYPEGHDASTSYLPGERLSTEPIAMQKARLNVRRVRNKKPLYVMGALALLAAIFWGVNFMVNPPTPYAEVCIDSRTQLVTDQARCEKQNDNATGIAYVPQEKAGNLKDLDSLPEGSHLTEPTGRVVIDKLGEE